MLVHAFTFTFTLSYVNTDNQNKRLTEQLWSAIEDMADMMLCMFMGNTWYVSVVVANERDWETGVTCVVLFTSQAVASDRLAIRSSGVLPISPAKPWAVAGQAGSLRLLGEVPSACKSQTNKSALSEVT